ncbi:MAG TPA: hypothetical protein VLI91_15735, partial [Roseiarcus sp.]|nr:hypothetical protein [Roseiarcus sp.]
LLVRSRCRSDRSRTRLKDSGGRQWRDLPTLGVPGKRGRAMTRVRAEHGVPAYDLRARNDDVRLSALWPL